MQRNNDKPLDYEKIFTPGAPVRERKYLFGRDQELNDLRKACRRPGFHPLVIGYRGVGKTSLAFMALSNYKPPAVIISCNPGTTTQILGLSILKGVGYDISAIESEYELSNKFGIKVAPFGIGLKANRTDINMTKRIEIGAKRLDPWEVYSALAECRKKYIIVIDEYDAITRNSPIHPWVASLIKHLSDHSNECDTRIVIIGIAQSANELLGKHESIERSAREIFLRPLRRDDVFDFFTEAESHLKIKFDSEVKKEIIQGSMGFPYYAHLIGLECMDALNERDKNAKIVIPADLETAIKRAVQHAFRSELRKYITAVKDLSENEKKLIKALVEEGGQPYRKDLEEKLEKSGVMSQKDFNNAWVRLQQEKRFLYVSRNDDTIRFCDPLLQPFLRDALFRTSTKLISSQ